MKECFVIMPIGSGEDYRIYRNRYDNIIKPAVEGMTIDGNQVFKCVRADFISQTGSITRVVIQRLYSSYAVIADLTDLNPNVFYELGVRHALRNKTILIALEGTEPPFDVGDLRIVWYEDRVGAEKTVIPEIQDLLSSFLEDHDQVDSPVFHVIPELFAEEDRQEAQAKLYALERENESLRSKLTVAEQINISFQQMLSSLTQALDKMTSRFGAEERQITEEEIEKVIRERQQILAAPKLFTVPTYEVDENSVFVLMPFSLDAEPLYEIIQEAAKDVGLRCYRADEILFTGSIMDQIFESVLRAGLIVADLTGRNPNVLYEVGVATTIGKEIVFLTQTIEDVPFDIRYLRFLMYEYTFSGVKKLRENLRLVFTHYIQSRVETEKPKDA